MGLHLLRSICLVPSAEKVPVVHDELLRGARSHKLVVRNVVGLRCRVLLHCRGVSSHETVQ